MQNSNIPTNMELPSTKQLIKSTVIAAIAAGVLLVAVVMPAEYGIDPTGMGEVLGLQKMGEIKVSLAAEVEADKAKDMQKTVEKIPQQAISSIAAPASTTPVLSHEMQVTLAADEGTEIKVDMKKGKKMTYTWWTDKGKANYDVHGDSKELKIKYHNYEKGSKQRATGTIEAVFNGSHGWFWRNRTGQTITITLQTKGAYTAIKKVH